MANRRMLSTDLVDSDIFDELSCGAQALYFRMLARSDDDGFVANTKNAIRSVGTTAAALDELLNAGLVISFPRCSVIVHFNFHNSIRADRKTPTLFVEEKAQLALDESGTYYLINADLQSDFPRGEHAASTPRACGEHAAELINKVNEVNKISEGGRARVRAREDGTPDKPAATPTPGKKKARGRFGNVKLTDDEVEKLRAEYGEEKTAAAITRLDKYIAEWGYKSKSHYLAIRRWVMDAVEEHGDLKKARSSPPGPTMAEKTRAMLDEFEKYGHSDPPPDLMERAFGNDFEEKKEEEEKDD